MRFEIEATKSQQVNVELKHDEGKLRLRLHYKGSASAAFDNVLTYNEARALAGGIKALLDGKPE